MKVVFFAPHSAIWVHAFPEALVAEALQQQGHEIVYVSCGGTLSRYCVPMSAHGLAHTASDDARRNVCAQCDRHDEILRAQFGFRGPRLKDLLEPQDELAVETILADMTPREILTFERDGVFLGRLALYQFMLRHKRLDLDFSETEWQEYLVELRNTLYAWRAGRCILESERPDRVIVYNGLYSVNRVVCKLAEQRGIQSYFMHAGGNLSNRLQTLMLARGDTYRFMPHVVSQWPRFRDVPCNGKSLSLVSDHYVELFRSKSVFVYSDAKSAGKFDPRAHFGVQDNQRLLVATMGSYDEEVAAEMVGARQHRSAPLFATQVDWINAVLEFVSTRPDLFLVIRVHPREFPNRRDRTLSQHAQQLQQSLKALPPNAAVNWPSDEISMYDLADGTDVFLNSWSSVGKEMSLLGIPVVIYSEELAFYPSDLNYVGTTRHSYFEAIDHALAEGWSVERARRAYRWGTLEFSRSLIFIDDSYSQTEHGARPLYRRITDRVRRFVDPYFKLRADCRRRAPRLSASEQVARLIESGADSVLEQLEPAAMAQCTVAEETQALKRELGRLARTLYPTPELRAGSRLYGSISSFAEQP